MTTEKDSAAAQDIPVPPAGGSWTRDGTKWVSNDPAPEADLDDQGTTTTIEQEQ